MSDNALIRLTATEAVAKLTRGEVSPLELIDAAAARIAEVYGVEVLRVQEVTVDGRAAYAITVMNPGGNSNAAFQVNTLLADAATGNLLPVFRHRPAGYDPPGAATYESKVDGLALRRRSFAE